VYDQSVTHRGRCSACAIRLRRRRREERRVVERTGLVLFVECDHPAAEHAALGLGFGFRLGFGLRLDFSTGARREEGREEVSGTIGV
jgi:hypothetical protein